MTTTVIIDVTPDDIALSLPRCALRCAVARAAARVLPHSDREPIAVSAGYLCYGPWVARKAVALPREASDWIVAHDAGTHSQPIRFAVEVES